MKHYKIFYNDGAYAETITFIDKSETFINKYLLNRIKEYNKNPNKDYHINYSNIAAV